MNKKGVLKIAGIVIVPLLVMTIAAYFLYPYFNEEEYEAIAEKYDRRNEPVAQVDDMKIGKDFQTLVEQVKLLKSANEELNNTIDTLRKRNKELAEQLKAREKQEISEQEHTVPEQTDSMQTTTVSKEDIPEEKFGERIKSLLNLDNEDLTPIVNEMTDEQLVRLYKGGSSIQRKKLLRSLDPKRAAKLMTNVML